MTIAAARRCSLWFALFAQAVLCSASASAQIVVLRVDPAAEPLCGAIEMALSSYGLVPDPGYFQEAMREGLDPTSEQALTMLTPPANARIAIVPMTNDGSSSQVELRDGSSGASLGSVQVPLQNGQLGTAGERVLKQEVGARLSGRSGAATGPQATYPMPSRAQPKTEIEAGGSDDADGSGDDGTPAAEPEAEGESEEAALRARVYVGMGLGTRGLAWPAQGQMLSVKTGAFAAIELGATLGIGISKGVSLGPELEYQTSLDHKIKESHIAGEQDEIGIRAHHLEALLALGLHLGDKHDLDVVPAIGVGTRNLRPAVHHLSTPSYSLAGPMLRVGLRIPLSDGISLRLAPEAQLLFVGKPLQDLGVASTGVSVGGEAGFQVGVSDAIGIELSYREAHALLSSTEGSGTHDVERFATARLVWEP